MEYAATESKSWEGRWEESQSGEQAVSLFGRGHDEE
jgi:hypothetical protein